MHHACIVGYAVRMDTTVVQVRDVPVEVVAALKARAEARGQSLAAYLRDLLAREAEALPIEDVMASIASREPVSYTIEDVRSFATHGRR
jgi:antitoxin FitA